MKRGFTLVELLVVITIIIVLLALLTPALDTAMYQAQLAGCAAGMDGIMTGVASYAIDQRRHYPFRPPVHDETGSLPNYQPSQLSSGPSDSREYPTGTDERPMLRPYVNLDAYFCPPSGSLSVSRSDPETVINTAYQMFYGYRWRGASAGSGMFRMGDRIGWDGRRFNVIISDHYHINAGNVFGGWVIGPHPDSKGSMVFSESQDKSTASGTILESLVNPPADKATNSGWSTTGGGGLAGVGTFRLNFGFIDGGVRRYDDVWWDLRPSSQRQEKRMVRVPVNFHDAAVTTPLNAYLFMARDL